MHDQGVLLKLLHTRRGRLDPASAFPAEESDANTLALRYGHQPALVRLARAHSAAWALGIRLGALDEVMERFGARARRGDDMTAQSLMLVGIVREMIAEGAILSWPQRLRGIPVPTPLVVRRTLDVLCADGRSICLGLFDAGELWTAFVARRRGAAFDLFAGPDELRPALGLLSGDWRRDHHHLTSAVEDRYGPLAFGCFTELSTFRALQLDGRPGAWSRAVAVRDVVIAPMPAAVGIALGFDGARYALRGILALTGRVAPIAAIGPMVDATRARIAKLTGKDVGALLGFDPLAALRAAARTMRTGRIVMGDAVQRLRRALPTSTFAWVRWVMALAAWVIILAQIRFVLAPAFVNTNTIGGHDWDQMESHRYVVMKTILRFHQFPFWDPYSCGGHTTWGGVESATNVVSPWLPFYLLMNLPHAMRAEIVGSALVSALGAWLLAGRFTRSPAARALVVVAFSVNGRWALQIASGHTWHLAYAWVPWALYFYDRAVGADPTRPPPRRRDVVLLAACLAIMVYTGGIYPLPHVSLAIALYGVFLAFLTRSFRPIWVGLAAAPIALGLAASKLLPIVDVFWRHPRLVDSTEAIDLTTFLAILTAPNQVMGSMPARVPAWGWHEYGMYVGWTVVVLVTLGCLFGRGVRESPLKWVGLFFTLLGFGAFDPNSPWAILHQYPVFRAQHVPTRWMYTALLLLLVVTAAVLEKVLRRSGRARAWLEVGTIAAVAWIARDVGVGARQALEHAFSNGMPPVVDSLGPFHTEIHMPAEFNFSPDWAPPSLPAEMGNFGTIDCGTFPAFDNVFRDKNGRTPGLGARGRGDPLYKGEVFVAEGVGQAKVTSFTPNVVTVQVTGATAGEHLVLNQNWDPGWRADGVPAINLADQVAATLSGPNAIVVFRFRSRFFGTGLVALAVTVAAIGYGYWRARRGRLPAAV